jgi:hypothetical protein
VKATTTDRQRIDRRQKHIRSSLTPTEKIVFKYCIENTYVICEPLDREPRHIARCCNLDIKEVRAAIKRLISLDIIDKKLSYIIS